MNIDLSVPIWTIEHVAAALHLEVVAQTPRIYPRVGQSMEADDGLAVVLREFARTLVTDFPIKGILDHLVRRIVDILPIDAAGVSLVSPTTHPHLIAGSDESAIRYEHRVERRLFRCTLPRPSRAGHGDERA